MCRYFQAADFNLIFVKLKLQKEWNKEKVDTQLKLKELNEKLLVHEQQAEISKKQQANALNETKVELEKINEISSKQISSLKVELKLARDNFERITNEFE